VCRGDEWEVHRALFLAGAVRGDDDLQGGAAVFGAHRGWRAVEDGAGEVFDGGGAGVERVGWAALGAAAIALAVWTAISPQPIMVIRRGPFMRCVDYSTYE
jgi:hypothetical protein